ncbi:MAG: pyridoxal-phosphate-dependent aminotransferase family protein [Thermomicrobiales bacterium]
MVATSTSIHSTAFTRSLPSDPRLANGKWLRIPGPTVLHPAVIETANRPMVPHRSPEATELVDRLAHNLKLVHATEQTVLWWTGTGSAGWEASIVNLTSPGDRIVVTVSGDFGDRYAKTAARLGLQVHRIDVEWGTAVTPDMLDETFREHGPFRAAFITHSETSTGLANPLKELAAVARSHGALVVVDAVSSAAAMPVNVDAWDLDWVLSGSQKAWMCPPGLMISAVSERAMAAAEESTFPRFIWDVRTVAEAMAHHTSPQTPALSLQYALDAAVTAMLDEGLEAMYARHARLGGHMRDGLRTNGLRVLADPAYPSQAVTAFRLPEGFVSSQDFHDRLRDEYGIEIAIGQGHLAQSVLRVGHMGYVDQPELDATIEAIADLAKRPQG